MIDDNKIKKLQNYDYSSVRLHIATPCYGGMVGVEYMRAVCEMINNFTSVGIDYHISTISNDSLVTRARNCLVASFLSDPKATHLLFIDADITFTYKSVYRLIASDYPVVGGIYPMKGMDWSNIKKAIHKNPDISENALLSKASRFVINLTDPSMHSQEGLGRVDNGFVNVANIGTGFMLIKREVFDVMAVELPELRIKSDIPSFNGKPEEENLWGFFDTWIHPKSKRYLSEDYAFCQRWISLGGEVYADLMCPLHHRGSHVFVGSAYEFFKDHIKKNQDTK